MRLVLLLFLVTGCLKVGPNFQNPPVRHQASWMECEDKHINCNETDLSFWWTYFNDSTLDELIAFAKLQNLDLKTAGYRILEARARLGIAVGEFFPQIQQWQGEMLQVEVSNNAPNSFALDPNFWNYQLNFFVAWELDFWGRFRRGIEAADRELQASCFDYFDVLVILLGDVSSTYVTIRTIEARIAILLENIKIQKRSLQIVEARWQAGAVTELDVQQARTLLYGTESRLPVLQADLQASKNTLATLLGLTPGEILCFLDKPGPIPNAPAEVGVGIPADLICRRPDVRRTFYEAAAQSARIGIAISDLFPAITISGLVGWNSSGNTDRTKTMSGGKFFSGDSVQYTWGPAFAWKVLNYGRLTNQVNVERARFCQLVTFYQNTVLTAYQEVESSLMGFVKAHEQVESLLQSVKSSRRAADLARTQYVEGLADYTRVLNTEQALVEQAEQLAIAKGSISQNLIATYRALGGGWMCE